MNKLSALLLLIIFYGCKDYKPSINSAPRNNPLTIDTSIITDNVNSSALPTNKKKSLHDYMDDDSFQRWKAKHPDTTGYICGITFRKEYALYWYHSQCIYSYFTYRIPDDMIELLWSYKVDCLLDMGFLEASNGIKNKPKHGDVFATYKLVNDTTIYATYNYPAWVKKVNEIAQDSLFPAYLYLVN